MIKYLFTVLFAVCGLQSFSQTLIYKSNGNILNSENQKVSPEKVRELLANNEQLLAKYNAGRSKKTLGNMMLYGGLGLFLGNTYYQLLGDSSNYNDLDYNNGSPMVASIVGLGLMIVAIPVKIGFSKKIKNVVTDYNNQKATGNINFEPSNLNLITTSNGIGFRLTFN